MNRRAHAFIGAGIGALYVIARHCRQAPESRPPFPVDDLILYAGIGALCGSLPDLIEPATSPNHRQFFHSAAAAAIAGYGAFGSPGRNMNPDLRKCTEAIVLGYLAHLGADATTAKGVPLLGLRLK